MCTYLTKSSLNSPNEHVASSDVYLSTNDLQVHSEIYLKYILQQYLTVPCHEADQSNREEEDGKVSINREGSC